MLTFTYMLTLLCWVQRDLMLLDLLGVIATKADVDVGQHGA